MTPIRGGSDQMDDASLDYRMRPGRLDSLRYAFEPIAADDQHVLHTTISEICAYISSESRAFGLGDP